MINNVSFGGVQASTFSDMINRPQAYKGAGAPAAATNVAGDTFTTGKPKKKHTVLKLALGAAAIGGLLVAGNKTGVSKAIEGKCPKIGKALQTAGTWIETKVTDIVNTVKDKFPSKAAEEAVEELV